MDDGVSAYQIFVARYSYDPVQYSPNDNPDLELPLTAGEYVFIYGNMDEVSTDGRRQASSVTNWQRLSETSCSTHPTARQQVSSRFLPTVEYR